MPMAKKRTPAERWKDEPEKHDFQAASDYLSLLVPEDVSARLVESLKTAETMHRKAKDLLRASSLPLLTADDVEVAKDLTRARKGALLSPVLLVRGDAATGRALIVADGYHRICASYHLNEDEDIPCRIIELS